MDRRDLHGRPRPRSAGAPDATFTDWPFAICRCGASSRSSPALPASTPAGASSATATAAMGSGLRPGALRPPRRICRGLGYTDESRTGVLVARDGPPPRRRLIAQVAADCASSRLGADHPLRADPEPRRHRPDRRARAGGRAAQGACAALPARAHRRRHRQRAPRAAASRFPHARWAAPTTPSSTAARVQLFVTGPAAEARRRSPSSCRARASRDYGAPFAEIFRRFDGDFYAIDPMLFSPAEVIVTALETRRQLSAPARVDPRPARCLLRLSERRGRAPGRASPRRRCQRRARLARARARRGVCRRCGVEARADPLARMRVRHAARRRALASPAFDAACRMRVLVRTISGGTFEAVTLRLGVLHALASSACRCGTMRAPSSAASTSR